MTMQIAVLGSIFMHSLPIEFYNLYIFFASKESLYTQIKLFITISLIYTGFKWNDNRPFNDSMIIGHFTVMDGSKPEGDLVLIQTRSALLWKLFLINTS